MRTPTTPFKIPIVRINVSGVQKGCSILKRIQSDGLVSLTNSHPPAIFPKDWNPSCRLLDKTGLLSYFIEAASIEMSPILIASKITKSIATTYLCYS
jgi:hypothetical protein